VWFCLKVSFCRETALRFARNPPKSPHFLLCLCPGNVYTKVLFPSSFEKKLLSILSKRVLPRSPVARVPMGVDGLPESHFRRSKQSQALQRVDGAKRESSPLRPSPDKVCFPFPDQSRLNSRFSITLCNFPPSIPMDRRAPFNNQTIQPLRPNPHDPEPASYLWINSPVPRRPRFCVFRNSWRQLYPLPSDRIRFALAPVKGTLAQGPAR